MLCLTADGMPQFEFLVVRAARVMRRQDLAIDEEAVAMIISTNPKT